jgi:hypothetical protein
MLPGLLRLGRHLAGIGSDSRDNLLRQADSDIVAGVTAAEAKALLLAYLEIHNDEISEPEFTDWLDTISTPLERATDLMLRLLPQGLYSNTTPKPLKLAALPP